MKQSKSKAPKGKLAKVPPAQIAKRPRVRLEPSNKLEHFSTANECHRIANVLRAAVTMLDGLSSIYVQTENVTERALQQAVIRPSIFNGYLELGRLLNLLPGGKRAERES